MDKDDVKQDALSSGLSEEEARLIKNFIARNHLYELKNNAGAPKRKRKAPNGEGGIRYRADKKLYEARVTVGWDKAGRAIRKSVYGKKRSDVVEKKRTLENNRGSKFYDNKFTVASLIRYWLDNKFFPLIQDDTPKKQKRAYSTYRAYDRTYYKYIEPRFSKMPANDLTPRILRDYYDTLEYRSVPTTLSKMFGAAYRFGEFEEIVDHNPASDLTYADDAPNVRRRSLLVSEQNDFISAVNRCPEPDIMLTYLFSGMRRNELLPLHAENIDLEHNVFQIKNSAGDKLVDNRVVFTETDTKTDLSDRVAPIPRRLRSIFERAIKRHPTGLLFPSPKTGKMYNPNTIDKWFGEIRNSLGWDKNIVLHCLRYTYISNCAAAGVDNRFASQWAGHTVEDDKPHSKMTQHYTIIPWDAYGPELDKLNEFIDKNLIT